MGISQVAFCRIAQLKALVLKLSNGEASIPQDISPLISAITTAIQRLLALLRRIREVSLSLLNFIATNSKISSMRTMYNVKD